MPHPSIKVGPDLGAVAADMRKGKLAAEFAGVADAALGALLEYVSVNAAQNVKLRGVIERAQMILTAHMEPDGIPASSTINLLLELLDGPQTRDAMGDQN